MTEPWQELLVLRLREALPSADITPYGSVVDHGLLDGWSDLDLEVHLPRSVEAEHAFGAPLWAWQETLTDQGQRLRLVLLDGRRIDILFSGARFELPDPPDDLGIRFDAALAAVRLGRGSRLIGLHLLLGILRAALVQAMLLADRDSGTTHHRHDGPRDGLASEVAAVLTRDLQPRLVLEACELHERLRREVEPAHRADWSGLVAVIERGSRP